MSNLSNQVLVFLVSGLLNAALTKSNVVLVEVDFPRVNNQSEATKNQNNMLQQQFGVQGYPTCWFVNAEKTKEGKNSLTQLGSQGYLAGGPTNWVTSAKNIINSKK
jgi:hypothetical protein